ncbi:MAG: S41 family peptidase [Planctomycetota bacterium]
MPLRNILIIALTAIIAIACYSVSARNRYANLVAEAMHLIETEALHEVPREDLFKAAMNGMTDQLDEHSIYISGDDFTALDEDMNQQFGGVGMYVDTDPQTDKLVVLAPIPDTPAFNAGIRVGDEIIEIAGISTEGYERGDAVSKMRGPAGTTVEVSIMRDQERLEFELERAVIPVPSVSGDWRNSDGTWLFHLKDDPQIGYIRLTQFGKKSTEEMREAVTEMNGNVDGLILDLRNNAGGLLSSAIDICDMFLDEPLPVVRTRGRDRVLLEQHFCTDDVVLDPGVPLVILVNRHSASASEIVAGCLQDHGRAVIVGEQTFGKGTVQDLIPLQRGRSVLKLTVASFWRPSDRQIDRTDPEAKRTGVWGIQPETGLEVALTTEMVFENIRQRNLRDLAGLNPDIYDSADRLFTLPDDDENTGPESETESTTGPEPDDDPEDETSENPQAPADRHIDLPLEKAREYLKSHLAIAA